MCRPDSVRSRISVIRALHMPRRGRTITMSPTAGVSLPPSQPVPLTGTSPTAMPQVPSGRRRGCPACMRGSQRTAFPQPLDEPRPDDRTSRDRHRLAGLRVPGPAARRSRAGRVRAIPGIVNSRARSSSLLAGEAEPRGVVRGQVGSAHRAGLHCCLRGVGSTRSEIQSRRTANV